jgi:hypothetical protein
MSLSQGEFDPLVVVGHWLDACRLGKLDALLELYDERATSECHCEPKPESKLVLALSLYGMALAADGVQADYESYEGNPVRMHFRFSPSGKILHTSCGPLER